ncbi:4030_t:CDS:1, partial [Racocetra fulgida]
MHGCQSMLLSPPSSNLAHQQNGSPIQSSHSRSDRILSNSPTVFPMSMAPPSANILLEASPTIQPTMPHNMQHNTSVIHSLTSHHRSSIPSDRPLTTADQRELARKVSHSAIERRRRERINDKIMQLKELIPSCADQDHLNKLCILQSSIEYIEYLQDLVVTYRQREKDGGRTDDKISSENGRKRSKFDRYDILPSSKLSSRRFEIPEDKEYKHKNSVSSSTLSTSPDQSMDPVVNTEKVNNDNTDSTLKADISDITPMLLDQEDADALSSKSTSTVQKSKAIIKSTYTVQESKKIITTRNSETQTSPIHDWGKSFKELKDEQETQASLSYE